VNITFLTIAESYVCLSVLERRRREALEARRLARELSVEANTFLWEQAVMPDWKKAMRDPNLRKLWWDGESISCFYHFLVGYVYVSRIRGPHKASKCSMGARRW
jgi:hypothetical protein